MGVAVVVHIIIIIYRDNNCSGRSNFFLLLLYFVPYRRTGYLYRLAALSRRSPIVLFTIFYFRQIYLRNIKYTI